jgi:peptide chain release factor 2
VKGLRKVVETVRRVEQSLEEVELFLQMGRDDPAAWGDVQTELTGVLERTEKEVGDLEFQVLLGGEHDAAGCFLQISAGAGGLDSCDWAAILLRMYTRWASAHGYKIEEIERIDEPEAGIRSATIQIHGEYAFGYLKAEAGVHRLVRISPFDAQKRRHTSFASVFIYPQAGENGDVEIQPNDIRIDTFRAGGAGGQHVNKTESAIRITHLPTGLVVQCQNERSQHRNRDAAMSVLKARLYALRLEEEKEKRDSLGGGKKDNAWGSQIRSYVFQPYTQVKDHRTDVLTSDVQGVMDGDIVPFIDAFLRQKEGP